MDVFVLKVRTDNSVVNYCAHVIMGVNLDGYKEVLGIWLGENESSKYWLNVLTDLKNRGVTDILMCTVDGLSGFKKPLNRYTLKLRCSAVLCTRCAMPLVLCSTKTAKRCVKI